MRYDMKPQGVCARQISFDLDGDVVTNVVFTNGAIADDDGKVYIYYAASDTRLHVASTTIGQLLDFAFKKTADPWSASARRLRPGARKAVVPAQSVMRKNCAST